MARRRAGKEPDSPSESGPSSSSSPFAALESLRGTVPSRPLTASEPKGPPPVALRDPIVLTREKKGRGGKTVTRVRGLPRAQLERLATEMKKALGCGATIEDADIVLLGSLVERAAIWLRARGATRVIEGN